MNNAAFLPAFTVSTNVVQSGGAIIDDGGFAITIAALLLHDPTLGATPDGGLTKLGAGSLTLASDEGYTGPTKILGGRLAVTDAKGLANTTSIQIAAGAELDVTGIPLVATILNGTKGSPAMARSWVFSVGLGGTLRPGQQFHGHAYLQQFAHARIGQHVGCNQNQPVAAGQ